MFTDLFGRVASGIDYRIYNAFEQELPQSLSNDQLYLIPGSRAGAYETDMWIQNLIGFVREAHKAEVPLAGVCFGHQLIAQALGGLVEPAAKGWASGERRSEIIDSKALEFFPEGQMKLLYNHGDQVVKLPAGARAFATSDFCPNEGFTVGNHIVTFQGHPEYTADYNRYVLLNRSADKSPATVSAALRSLDSADNMGLQAARWMLSLATR